LMSIVVNKGKTRMKRKVNAGQNESKRAESREREQLD